MSIRQEMTSAVDGTEVDLDRLTSIARTQGTRLVRRRRAATWGAAALVVVALGAGASVLGSGGTEADRATESRPAYADAPYAPDGRDLTRTAPATGPGAAAALRFALADVVDGTSDGFVSQGPYGNQLDVTGGLVLTSATTGVASFVQVTVTTGNDVPAGGLCGSMTRRCTRTALPDGSVLVTSDSALAPEPGPVNRSAVLWRPDGVQVQVSNDTGQAIPGHQGWGRLSQVPTLSFAQLSEVARQPWWGESLPATFVEEGTALAVQVTGDFD